MRTLLMLPVVGLWRWAFAKAIHKTYHSSYAFRGLGIEDVMQNEWGEWMLVLTPKMAKAAGLSR